MELATELAAAPEAAKGSETAMTHAHESQSLEPRMEVRVRRAVPESRQLHRSRPANGQQEPGRGATTCIHRTDLGRCHRFDCRRTKTTGTRCPWYAMAGCPSSVVVLN